jgi:hypothetical protein
MEDISKICSKYKLKEAEITEYDMRILSPFIVEIISKCTSFEEIPPENVKKIIESLNVQRVFMIIRSPFFEDYVSCNKTDLKFLEGGGEIYFEYLGKDIFNTEYIRVPLCEILFICNSDIIILWDHDGYMTIYQFKRVKTSRI